jgi:peptidoglycan/LPS O-acetylase OafA/YrhL
MHIKYRPDIDGLRAVAILSVVIYHAFPELIPGGFVGVDIFFVISGYLISSIIIKQLNAGNFSFIEFINRRIIRIFPALLLILITCYFFGYFSLFSDEYKQLSNHILGGAIFISNYLYMSENSYFENITNTKPLLHLWSLAIEEQFYIVWPLLVMLVWKRKINLLIITLLILIVSFTLNIKMVGNGNLIAAFYSPYTRFWELLCGASLAFTTQNYNKIKTSDHVAAKQLSIFFDSKISYHNVFSIMGGVLLICGFVLISKERQFPGWWSLLPTLGAIFIIAAGEKVWLNRVVLSSKIMVWFGLISFPLYLWHWPLLSFARIIESQEPSTSIRVLIIFFSIILSWITYRLIEIPLRNTKIQQWKKATILLSIMMIIGSIGYVTYKKDGFKNRNIVVEYESKYKIEMTDRSPQANMSLPLGAQPRVMILGDSHAGRLALGLAYKYGPYVANFSAPGCIPFYNVDRFDARFVVGTCLKQMNEALDIFERNESMKTIILSSMGPVYLSGKVFNSQDPARVKGDGVTLAGRDDLSDRYEIFRIGLVETIKRLHDKNKNIIFVLDVPELGFDPHGCIKNRPFQNLQRDTCAVLRKDYELRNEKYKKLVYSVLKDFPTVEIFDPTNILCDKKWCWAIKNNKFLYGDPDHLSAEGSKYLVNYLVPLIHKFDGSIPTFDK